MTADSLISKEEQLKAASQGFGALWDLVKQHVGETLPLELGEHITITKQDLTEYFREHPEEAEAHIAKEGSALPQHDAPVLQIVDGAYSVAWMHRGQTVKQEAFDDLCEAAATWCAYWM